MCMCVHVCVYACVCMYIYVYIYVYICVYICIYIFQHSFIIVLGKIVQTNVNIAYELFKNGFEIVF